MADIAFVRHQSRLFSEMKRILCCTLSDLLEDFFRFLSALRHRLVLD